MRMYDVIMKKRNGEALTKEEISFFITGYTIGEIPDYQVSALLMAIYFKGMDSQETAWLTQCMAESGEMIDLSAIKGIKVDKHSTGGVGDKTTLVIGPIVAACGVPVAKMSGRGLGHTGGTLDKLEAIPGLTTAIPNEDFFRIVNEIGISVAGQTGNLAPADKKLYSLRDVTATVDNLSLIAASIMSKKIASGANSILLDVKTGSGAFMKTLDDSIALAQAMVDIGTNMGRETTALITDMDRPLGFAIGNSLEVIEAVETLKGNGPDDLTIVCKALASNMLYLVGKGDVSVCNAMVDEVITNGKALAKLKEMVKAQGGDVSVIDDTSNFATAPICHQWISTQSGYITAMEAEKWGIASVMLGAGRATKDDIIDYSAGIVIQKKIGERIEIGDTIARLYGSTDTQIKQSEALLKTAIVIEETPAQDKPLIYARVSKNGVERLA